MYSVTIVWSAFAFIHLRLVSPFTPKPPSDIVTPLLVLLNVLLSCKTLTHAHTTPTLFHLISLHLHLFPFSLHT